MSQHGSFVFSTTALRSLQLDEDMLERHKHQRRLASHQLTSYMLKKEARTRQLVASGTSAPPAVCQDLVTQNALYTGDLEALRQLFPKGSRANFIIEPRGGEMRWFYMAELPKIHYRKSHRSDVIATAQASGGVLQFWNALLVGDALTLISIMDDDEFTFLVNSIYDTSNIEEWKDFRFNYRGLRLWSLTYEQELTTPLHITAGRGFADCLRLLLQRGADVELAPGGCAALHEACESCQPECTKLLLSHGADANAVSEDGLRPLHVCTLPESLECARQLLQYGAAINGRSVDEEDTPLHVAARNGLPEHTDLYLRYGAAVDRRNGEELTPLNAACAHPQGPQELQRYHKVCRLLLAAGADVGTRDSDRRTPLHMACKHANADVVDLLLTNGACVNDMDYGGEAPLHDILKAVCYKLSHEPERVVRSLLNYGSIRVWPGALPTVLKHCCGSPRTMEVLLNAYSRLKVTDAWVEAVPPEVFKARREHQDFYESLFSLAQAPRSLQHLARCRLRVLLEGRLHTVLPDLPLPTFIRNYLLLQFRGYVH
ncbi:Ankyrin repeat and SOCS box protein 10 [Merluccius polli]|uniref:Ankyrin repeat and SOCS box protein 10 n=1 Tax=Merluccius polli TaxID=89951 RepID=A0AA47M2B9_MERPO|nr:Ankyrin repeat and SOCS box protein 10 [Merluccius polli]